MYSLLLAVIYAAFISLGLPDSLLGSSWPVMQQEFGVPVSFAGIVFMIIAIGTVVASLLSDRLTRRFGAGKVTAASVLMTGIALLGFSLTEVFPLLCLWAIPYGLGAGAVDAALNNYVALHYTSRHMSWLHCFWGIGASVGPYIISACLSGGWGWKGGYRIISVLQLILTILLFLSLPLWKQAAGAEAAGAESPAPEKALGLLQVLRIPGVPLILTAFFCSCSMSQTCILWASSYLVRQRQVDETTAASFASLFLAGVTFGRFLSGFISEKLGDQRMIRMGILTVIGGLSLVALPIEFDGLALAGLVVAGLGCAPIYPSIIHSAPGNFGKEASQAVIGVQMAAAYIGTALSPPLFGVIASRIHIGLFPFFALFFAFMVLLMTELLNRTVAKRKAAGLKDLP